MSATEIQNMVDAIRAENDSSKETPAEETSTATASETPTGTSDDGKAQDAELPQAVKDILNQHPEHKAIVDRVTAEIKSGLTPKLQEAAELRKKHEELVKQYEGVDPQMAETIRQLNDWAETNPAKVVEYFRNQAEEWERVEAERRGPPDPLADYVPQSDADAALVKEVQTLKQLMAEHQKQLQQTALNQEAARVNRELDAVEKKYGVEIDDQQRVAAWEYARKSGLPVGQVWFTLNHESLIPKMLQKARDEASSVVQSKQQSAAGNPAGVATRATAPEEEPETIYDFLRQAREQIAANQSAY